MQMNWARGVVGVALFGPSSNQDVDKSPFGSVTTEFQNSIGNKIIWIAVPSIHVKRVITYAWQKIKECEKSYNIHIMYVSRWGKNQIRSDVRSENLDAVCQNGVCLDLTNCSLFRKIFFALLGAAKDFTRAPSVWNRAQSLVLYARLCNSNISVFCQVLYIFTADIQHTALGYHIF